MKTDQPIVLKWNKREVPDNCLLFYFKILGDEHDLFVMNKKTYELISKLVDEYVGNMIEAIARKYGATSVQRLNAGEMN